MRKNKIKGSCKQIPCGQPCNCKEWCENCCEGIKECYNIHNFKQNKIIWIQTKFITTKQLTLWEQ